MLYPAVAYYGLANGVAWVGLSMLMLILAYQAILFKEKRRSFLGAIIIISLGIGLAQSAMVKLVPVVIHISLFMLFYQSLKNGEPLIEKFASLDFPVFPPGMKVHCLQVTQVWTFFFAFIIVFNFALVTWGSDEAWALFNGVLLYILIGLLVVGEYIWRRIRFSGVEMPTLKETVYKITKNSRAIFDKKHD